MQISKLIIYSFYLPTITMEVGIVPLLLSKDSSLVINDKVDRERGTFEPNVDIRGGIDWQEFKGVYDSVVKVDI